MIRGHLIHEAENLTAGGLRYFARSGQRTGRVLGEALATSSRRTTRARPDVSRGFRVALCQPAFVGRAGQHPGALLLGVQTVNVLGRKPDCEIAASWFRPAEDGVHAQVAAMSYGARQRCGATLVDVLAPFGVGEDEFVGELSRELQAAPDASATRLTAAEEPLLRARRDGRAGRRRGLGPQGGVAGCVVQTWPTRHGSRSRSNRRRSCYGSTARGFAAASAIVRCTASRSAVGCGCRPGSSRATTRFPDCARCWLCCRLRCTRSRSPG